MNTQQNRWLKGYLERVGENNALHGHMPAPASHGRFMAFCHQHPILINVVASLLSAAIVFIADRALFAKPPTPIGIPVPAVTGQNPPLIAMKLERVPTQTDLFKLAQKFPESRLAAPGWNPLGATTAPQHEIFGQSSKRESYYLPVPRPRYEDFFAQLPRLTELKLFEIHISPRIPEMEFAAHPYLWARHCHVEEPWIETWSSWQTSLGDPIIGSNLRLYPFPTRPVFFENGCRPGGVCFVIAVDCDAVARRDFQYVQNNDVTTK